jgi:hypothetical protein
MFSDRQAKLCQLWHSNFVSSWRMHLKQTKGECTSVCVQKSKHDATTIKQLQNVRWFSSGTGFTPAPHDKFHEFIASPAPKDFRNRSNFLAGTSTTRSQCT